MNTEYLNTLMTNLKQAKDAINQWNEYKSKVEDALKEALQIPSQDDLYEQLKSKASGSTTLKPYEGLEAKFSVELSFDQDKIINVLQLHPELIGLVVKTKYEPVSAKALFTLIKSENPVSSELQSAMKVAKRGPYLSLKAEGNKETA